MNTLEKKVDALIRLCLCKDEGEKEEILKSMRELISGEGVATIPTTNYHDKVVKSLLELGTPDSLKGHKCVMCAIEMVLEHPDYIEQVTSVLYPEVAKKCGTTASRVERAIRHAIEVTWDRASFDTLDKYFGNTVSPSKGKPTNTEFISRIANALR